MTPTCPLTPLLLRSHVWLYPRIIFIQVPWKYVKVCGYGDHFFKNLNQRSLTPRWPLTPSLLMSHVWLYPRIIVSKSHFGMWIQWLLFSKTWTKGHWPLDDLWPHICWGHMCELNPRIIVSKSHGNTSMFVDTVINFAKYHIHTTYIHTVHTYVQT